MTNQTAGGHTQKLVRNDGSFTQEAITFCENTAKFFIKNYIKKDKEREEFVKEELFSSRNAKQFLDIMSKIAPAFKEEDKNRIKKMGRTLYLLAHEDFQLTLSAIKFDVTYFLISE